MSEYMILFIPNHRWGLCGAHWYPREAKTAERWEVSLSLGTSLACSGASGEVLVSVVPGPGPHWLTVTPDLTCVLDADSRDSVYFRSKSADLLWVWFSSPACPEEVAGDEAAVYSSARPETGPGRGPLQRLSPHLVLSATSEDFFMMSFLSTVKCFFKIVWFGCWRDS